MPTISSLACSLCASAAVMAGCADGDAPAEAPATANTVAPPVLPSDAVMPACVVGSWRSEALPPGTRLGPFGAEATGGAGIFVSIGPHGVTTVGFTRMQPIVFTAHTDNAEVRGRFSYAGSVAGTMTTDLTGTASSAESGTWQPTGDARWEHTTVTVDLTEPVQTRPFDNVALDRYTGDGVGHTAGVVDIDPFFDSGRFTCQGNNTLTVDPDEGDLPLVLVRI